MEKDIFWKVIPTPIPSPKYVEQTPKPSPKYIECTPKPPDKTVKEPPKLPRQSVLPVNNLMFIKDLVPEEKNKIAQLIQEVIRLEKENEEIYGNFLGLKATVQSQAEHITATGHSNTELIQQNSDLRHSNTELTEENSDLRHSNTELTEQNSQLISDNKQLQLRVKEQAKILRLPKRNVEIQCSPRQSHISIQHSIPLCSTGSQCHNEEISHCECDDGSSQSQLSGSTVGLSRTTDINLAQSQSRATDINLAQSQTMQKFVHQLDQLCDKLTVHRPAEENKENSQSKINVLVHRHDRDGVLVQPSSLSNEQIFDVDKDEEWIRPDLISIVDEIECFDGSDKASFDNILQHKHCKDTSMGFDDILKDLFFNP